MEGGCTHLSLHLSLHAFSHLLHLSSPPLVLPIPSLIRLALSPYIPLGRSCSSRQPHAQSNVEPRYMAPSPRLPLAHHYSAKPSLNVTTQHTTLSRLSFLLLLGQCTLTVANTVALVQ